jgi:hypothetical protein
LKKPQLNRHRGLEPPTKYDPKSINLEICSNKVTDLPQKPITSQYKLQPIVKKKGLTKKFNKAMTKMVNELKEEMYKQLNEFKQDSKRIKTNR